MLPNEWILAPMFCGFKYYKYFSTFLHTCTSDNWASFASVTFLESFASFYEYGLDHWLHIFWTIVQGVFEFYFLIWFFIVQILCVLPEYINLFFLTCGLYGMYQGIEIGHPVYAVLFLNLIVSTMSTVLDIVVFFFISTNKYVLFSNLVNALSVFFHCTSWCVTSVLRFVYIIGGDCFHNFIPNQNFSVPQL